MPGVRLQIVGASDWRLFREVRLQALHDAPYAFSSTLASWQGDGDREDRWRARLQSVPFNVVAHFEGRAAGMASGAWSDAAHEIELISMWVAPFARGKGVGDALVGAVLEWAEAQQIEAVELRVIKGNERARSFYRRLGFVDDGEVDSPDGRSEYRMVRR